MRSIGSQASGVLAVNDTLEQPKKVSEQNGDVDQEDNEISSPNRKTVLDELKDKHPAPKEVSPSVIMKGQKPRVENVIYEELDSEAIYSALDALFQTV